MTDLAQLRARLVAIADLHDRQDALCMAAGDPRMAAAAANARLGVLEAIDALDAMTAGREFAPLPDPTAVATATDPTDPTLFDLEMTWGAGT